MKLIGPAVVVLAMSSVGCGGGGAGNDSPGAIPVLPEAANFVRGFSQSCFPLIEGTTWILEGEELGLPRREEVRVLDTPRVLAGIVSTGLEQSVVVGGIVVEMTTEWFAEDRTGNVWKLGEESVEFDGLVFVPTADSWLVGQPGTWPFMAFPADPFVGARWIGYVNDGFDTFITRSRTASVVVPAGAFSDCLEIDENPDDAEDHDIILYAPGIGRVSESSPNGFVRLVEIRRP